MAGAARMPQPDLHSPMRRREFRAMGSKVVAILDGEPPAPILDDVPAWFEEWEQELSRFRIDSELSRLNASPGQRRAVSETIWDVFAVSLEAGQLTDGLVNPLILDDLVHAGYDRTFDLMQTDLLYEGVRAAAAGPWEFPAFNPLPAPGSIVIDEARRIVCLPPGAGLDFGGVAKGWAAHQAMLRLKAAGPALVSAGGDVSVSGPRASGDPWRIGVENPFQSDGYVEMIYLEGGGVATSGKDHRHWRREGIFQHHIIDPRTRLPASTDILSTTVIAGTVMRAEAIAKAVLISGSEAGLAMIEEWEDADAILVLDNGRLLYSRNIEMYL